MEQASYRVAAMVLKRHVADIRQMMAVMKIFANEHTSQDDPQHEYRVRVREIISNSRVEPALQTLSALERQFSELAEKEQPNVRTEEPSGPAGDVGTILLGG